VVKILEPSTSVAREPIEPPDLDEVDVVTVLQALSDPIRLEIVRQLAGCGDCGELTCGQIELPVTKSTASHHFKTLTAAGVIAHREAGTRKFVRLRREELDGRFPGLLESVLCARRAGTVASHS
jgi:DNA-binding transcriptional ArsR family regulator